MAKNLLNTRKNEQFAPDSNIVELLIWKHSLAAINTPASRTLVTIKQAMSHGD